ncbi:MAG TPA: DUF2934 domain-containing protein [Terriglobales bacterium]|nr:DUF2934 domain-containing protein [Terriglobales bacterium]
MAATPRKSSGSTGRSAKPPKSAQSEPGHATSVLNGLEEEIRQRAYELYVERGYEDGHDTEDWLRAESEVLSRHGLRTA